MPSYKPKSDLRMKIMLGAVNFCDCHKAFVINAFKRLSHNELLLSVGCIVSHKSLQTDQQWRDATRRQAQTRVFNVLCAMHIEWKRHIVQTSPTSGKGARLFNYLITLTPNFHRAKLRCAVGRENEPFAPTTESHS